MLTVITTTVKRIFQWRRSNADAWYWYEFIIFLIFSKLLFFSNPHRHGCRVGLSHRFAPAGIFESFGKNDPLDHLSHLSISADKKFHVLECFKFFRIVEKVVMKILHDFGKFLTVNHKTDVHE